MHDALDGYDLSEGRPYKRLGTALLRLRIARQLTCLQLAQRLGITVSSVSKVEIGDRLTSLNRLCEWAEALEAKDQLPTLLGLMREDAIAARDAGDRARPGLSRSKVQPRKPAA